MLKFFILFGILSLTTGDDDFEYIFRPGPLIPPSKGEIWPAVQHEDKQDDGYFYVLPSFFRFKNVGASCKILTDALKRYRKIIISNNRLIKEIFYEPKTCYDTSSWYYGYLTDFEVELTEPCNDDEYPFFQMEEKYVLNVTKDTQRLTSETIWGILRGLESFSQLIYLTDDHSCHRIETTNIYDYPRLSHRALHLDTARHYHQKKSILKFLDAMSYNKFNVFHWHIVDDYSFPFVSKKFPELSNKGAFDPQLMIYDQDFVSQVIEYARIREIRVINEFDTPGHTLSWGEGYPELLSPCYNVSNLNAGPLDPTKNSTYKFVEDLLAEVASIFKDKFIHIGGDEVDFKCWESDSNIADFMELNQIETYKELQNYYTQKIIKYVDDLHLTPIVWEEVFTHSNNLPMSTVVQIWRNDTEKGDDPLGLLKEVTSRGYQAILSAYWYLDILYTGGDWLKFYNFDPVEDFNGTETEKNLVIGGEACMWSEVVNEYNLEPRVWPRASVPAEKFWSAPGSKLLSDVISIRPVGPRLEEQTCRMNRRGIAAQPPIGPSVCY